MLLSFFAEMAWKSALISGAALALAYALSSRSAADRALVLRIGVALLLVLPVLAALLPSLEIAAFAAAQPAALAPYSVPPELQAAGMAGAFSPAPEPTIWDDPSPLVILAYLGGLAMVGSRLLAGLWTLHRWTGRARDVDCPEWLAAFDRVRWTADHAERVRLMVSDEVASPLSWGWRRPVILIDPDTLAQPEDAEAILAHEVAHIARGDWPVLMMSRLVATIFWFNPLVWILEREVVQQAEEAADCEAAQRVEPARYAETLLSWARANVLVPANSIAPSAGGLARRVKAILDRRQRERPSGSAWTAIAMLLCLGIGAPVAAMRLVEAAPPAPPTPPAAPTVPSAAAFAPQAPAAPDAPAAPMSAEAPTPPAPGEIMVDLPDLPALPAMPDISAAVAGATSAMDTAEFREAMREARAELRRMPPVDREQLAAAIREAQRAHARVRVGNRAEIENAVREARREQRRAVHVMPRAKAVSMAHSAEGMEQGAVGMEAGARRMEAEAARLDDRDYRERAIARARARGEVVTHEQLLEAAEGMREGAAGMREGATEMREAAERMRRHH